MELTISIYVIIGIVILLGIVLFLLQKRGKEQLQKQTDEMIQIIDSCGSIQESVDSIKEYARMHVGIQYSMIYQIFNRLI